MAQAKKSKTTDKTTTPAKDKAAEVPGVATATLADLKKQKEDHPDETSQASAEVASAAPTAPATTADAPPLPKPNKLPQRKQYRVTEDREVPRGASSFILRKGKIVTELGYDLDALRAAGVKLEEVKG